MSVTNASFTVSPPAYQLPAALTLGPVVLQVANIETSVAYYERVVGLRTLTRGSGRASLGAQQGESPLVHLVEKAGIQPLSTRARLGLYHFAILLPTRALLGQFLQHLSDIGVRAGMSDHLVSEAIYLTDPDGLGIEVYADRPRESWRLDGSAIAMAADPLDVPNLLAAGSGVRWSGAPSGTRMGHVHLYVGDLSASARFYHGALGFDKVNLQFPGALFLSAGGYHHHVGTNTWAASAPVATADDAKLLEWTIVVPHASDVAGIAASFEASGNEVLRELNSIVATDPWGTNVRVVSGS